MALKRYQIRNEYGLADKELYRATAKDDPEALFDAASIAGLVGVLRQLGDLAEFAAEVFDCLHEEVMKSGARGHGLSMRLQHLHIPILSQTQQHSTFFYHPGLEWHSNVQIEENMIASRKLPPCIMDSYEECRGPPQLYLLDKFDVFGSGSCLKRYSDPTLLKTKLNKDERPPRKPKKKGSHTTRAETPEDSKTSHTKLHQLFLLEHVENGHRNLEFHVKLKRRELSRPLINSSSRTGYMDNLLKNALTYRETEIQDTRKHTEMEMESIVNDERLEIPFLPQEIIVNDKSLHDLEGGQAICLEKSSSLSLCCNLDELEETSFENPPNLLEDAGVSLELIQSNKENVFSVETESEISLSGLVEDQFSSITNQEIDALKPTSLESICLLPNQYITTFDTFEDLSLAAHAQNTFEISSLSDEQEDPQSMSNVSDYSSEHEVPMLDTQGHGTCFGGLKDKGSENVLKIDFESISPREEVLLGTQESPITTSAESLHCLVVSTQGNFLDFPTETPEITPPPPPPPLLPLPPIQWWNEPSRGTEEQSPSAVNGRSKTYVHNEDERIRQELHLFEEESFASVSLLTAEVTSEMELDQGLNTDWRSEAMALEWFSQNLLQRNNNPNPPLRETEYAQKSNDVNGKAGKVPRDKESLVIGIDRSMLRKVSERNKTQVGARVDENDSLLEIIRSKSLNLRPADAWVRPNFQVAVPMTNLKVAAILEKANTLRQAVAGSDEEHDSDSWSE